MRDWYGYCGPIYQAGRVRYRLICNYFDRKPHIKLFLRSPSTTGQRKEKE